MYLGVIRPARGFDMILRSLLVQVLVKLQICAICYLELGKRGVISTIQADDYKF